MGMSASQGRLLSLTARMSDLELQAQVISNSKVRLSQESQQASRDYSEALDKERLRVFTGLQSDGTSSYMEATVNNLTTFQGVSSMDQQRFIKDSAGKLIVSPAVARAYDASGGTNLEVFLNNLGALNNGHGYTSVYTSEPQRLASVNTGLMTSYNTAVNNLLSLIKVNGQVPTQNTQYDSNATLQLAAGPFPNAAQGNAFKAAIDQVVNVLNQINSTFSLNPPVVTSTLEGCATMIGQFPTAANGYVDDVASCLLQNTSTLAQNYINPSTMSENNLAAGIDYENSGLQQLDYNSSAVTYYTNLFEELQESGGYNEQSNDNLNNSEWLTAQINAGNLFLYTYNRVGGEEGTGDFEAVSWQTGDNSLRMVSDDTDLARAEAEYERTMADIQSKDKRFDLELKDIDTEHTAVQTELESVKKVINKNIDRNLKMFDA